MLRLPDITVMAIDCFTPDKTALAVSHAMRIVKFGDAVILTDTAKTRRTIFHPGCRIIHHTQGKEFVSRPGMKRRFAPDYELSTLREPSERTTTPFILFMEWDSCVLNPAAWTDNFLSYDYIGAPWPDHHDPGWPACGDHNNVGNGGFSLRSKRFCKTVREFSFTHQGDPAMAASDSWVCRTMRPKLEGMGLKFAPEAMAARFSCENKVYAGQFGFHGKHTAEMNNWGGWMKNIRP